MPTRRDDAAGGGPVELAAAVEDALTLAYLRRACSLLPRCLVVLRRRGRCYVCDGDVAALGRAGVALARHGPDLASFPADGLQPALASLRAAGLRAAVFARLA